MEVAFCVLYLQQMGTREDVWKEETLYTETVLGVALTPVISGRQTLWQNTARRLDALGGAAGISGQLVVYQIAKSDGGSLRVSAEHHVRIKFKGSEKSEQDRRKKFDTSIPPMSFKSLTGGGRLVVRSENPCSRGETLQIRMPCF